MTNLESKNNDIESLCKFIASQTRYVPDYNEGPNNINITIHYGTNSYANYTAMGQGVKARKELIVYLSGLIDAFKIVRLIRD